MCFGCLVRVSQNLKFLYCASIFIGNFPVSALHALLLQYLFTPSNRFKNLVWTNSAGSFSIWLLQSLCWANLVCVYAVADPDLPIKGWGLGGLEKTFFPALLASVLSKNSVGVGSRGGGEGRPLPWIPQWHVHVCCGSMLLELLPHDCMCYGTMIMLWFNFIFG